MEPPDEETQKLLDELEDNLRSKISNSGKVRHFCTGSRLQVQILQAVGSGDTHLILFVSFST